VKVARRRVFASEDGFDADVKTNDRQDESMPLVRYPPTGEASTVEKRCCAK
jgi:hypothetical protein